MEKKIDASSASVASLAYLGDSVVELLVRTHLISLGYTKSEKLNRASLDFVTAKSQAHAMERILPILSGEEAAIYRRGKNIGHLTPPKSATRAEYNSATGMEVLFGYLYLAGRQERLSELFAVGYPEEENDNNK